MLALQYYHLWHADFLFTICSCKCNGANRPTMALSDGSSGLTLLTLHVCLIVNGYTIKCKYELTSTSLSIIWNIKIAIDQTRPVVFFPFLSSVAGVAWRSPGVAWHHCLETLGDLQATPSYARQQREQPKGSFDLLVAVDRKRNGNKNSVMVVVIISVCFNTRNVDTIAKKILHTVTLVTL